MLLDTHRESAYPQRLVRRSFENLYADVAQLAEQLICNQQVASSNLAVSSSVACPSGSDAEGRTIQVGYSSGQRDQTVNLTANAFEGSNPSPTMLDVVCM